MKNSFNIFFDFFVLLKSPIAKTFGSMFGGNGGLTRRSSSVFGLLSDDENVVDCDCNVEITLEIVGIFWRLIMRSSGFVISISDSLSLPINFWSLIFIS